jgi:hypothetical protein
MMLSAIIFLSLLCPHLASFDVYTYHPATSYYNGTTLLTTGVSQLYFS